MACETLAVVGESGKIKFFPTVFNFLGKILAINKNYIYIYI